MHWWYFPILLFAASLATSWLWAPKGQYEESRLARRLIVLGLLISALASCSGGLLARWLP